MTSGAVHLNRVLIGIDVGGTKVATAAITLDGHILGRSQGVTAACSSYSEFVEMLVCLVEEVYRAAGLDRARIAGIGIGSPGPINPELGTVHNPYTLPLPDGSDIVTPLRRHFDVPVVLEGDAFCAALGECWLGAAVGRELVACVTIGTGIGCGIVRRGRVLRGARGVYPEIGHHAVDPAGPQCYCGARGCWEILASGTAISLAGQGAARSAHGSALLQLAGGKAENVTSELVFQAARSGDHAAAGIVAGAVRATAIGVFNLVHFLAPDAIVLGGGVMRHYDLFEPAIREALSRITVVPQAGLVLAKAQLGQDAGLLGAARAVALAAD